MKCDVKNAVCMKLLSLFNIDSQEALNNPYLGIIDLSISVETMTKYQPVDLKSTDEISPEVVTSFQNARLISAFVRDSYHLLKSSQMAH